MNVKTSSWCLSKSFLNYCFEKSFLFWPDLVTPAVLFVFCLVLVWQVVKVFGPGWVKHRIYPLIGPVAGWEGRFQEISCKQKPHSAAELESRRGGGVG